MGERGPCRRVVDPERATMLVHLRASGLEGVGSGFAKPGCAGTPATAVSVTPDANLRAACKRARSGEKALSWAGRRAAGALDGDGDVQATRVRVHVHGRVRSMTTLERIRQPSTPLRSGYAVSIAIGYCLLERDVIQSQCMMYGQRPGCPGGSERRGQKEDAKTGRWEGKLQGRER